MDSEITSSEQSRNGLFIESARYEHWSCNFFERNEAFFAGTVTRISDMVLCFGELHWTTFQI